MSVTFYGLFSKLSKLPSPSAIAPLLAPLALLACQDAPVAPHAPETQFLPPAARPDVGVISTADLGVGAGAEGGAGAGAQGGVGAQGGGGAEGGVGAQGGAGAASAQEVGWVSLTLNPANTFYTLSATPAVEVQIYNIYGQPLPNARAEVRVEGGLGRAEGGRLAFEAEGEGAVVACAGAGVGEGASGEPVCTSRPLVVDDAAPAVVVEWPPRGAQLSALDPLPEGLTRRPPDNGGAWIPVVGYVEDGQGEVIVRLNGDVIEAPGGRFEAFIPAQLGYNRVEITVDDRVRAEEARDARWVLWAERYAPFEAQRSVLTRGAQLSLNQAFLDDDAPVDWGADPLVAGELAQLLELMVGLVDPMSLLAAPSLINTTAFSLSVADFALGLPRVDVFFTDQGLSLFMEFDHVTVSTTGGVTLNNQRVSLNGDIAIGVAVYAEFTMQTRPNAPLDLTATGAGVAVTSVDATFANPSAEALIEALDTQARALISDAIDGALNDLVSNQLPPLLEQSVNTLFGTMRALPIDLNTGLEGQAPLSLTLHITPEELLVSRRQRAALWCDVDVTHSRAVAGPGEGIEPRGVPMARTSAEPPEVDAPFALHLQLNTLNALLAEVWRGGLLSLTPPLPPETAALVREARVVGLTPPVLTLGDLGDPFPLYLELGALSLSILSPLAPEIDEYEVYARVGAHLALDGGAFVIELEETPEVRAALAVRRNARPALSELLIERVISTSVWPTLSSAIAGQIRIGLQDVPLATRDFAALGVSLSSARVSPSFDPDIRARLGWISLRGLIEASFSVAP